MEKIMIRVIILILFVSLIFAGCEKTWDDFPGLSGVWVESTYRQDTIIFNSHGSNTFVLSRGMEERDGYLLPKAGSGIFSYELKPDSIKIVNMIMSCLCYETVYFNLSPPGNIFVIGNFYDTAYSSSYRNTFIKVK
jgi:hypothetical protein